MTKSTGSRWDAFTPWELQALDEFFRNFGSHRDYCEDIGKIGREIAAQMTARNIPPFGSVDPIAPKTTPKAAPRGNDAG